jgi:hypothetical protein
VAETQKNKNIVCVSTSKLRDLELLKTQPEIKDAEEKNKILREARRAAEAVAAATAGEGFRGRGPPGQSSKGKEPAAAAAGDDGLTQYLKELLDRTRDELKNPTCKKFLNCLRKLVGRDTDESEAEETDDEENRRPKTRSKPKKKPLTMANLATSLYNFLVPKPPKTSKKKSEANTVVKEKTFALTFTDKNNISYDHIKLEPTDIGILPEEVVKVTCSHVTDIDLIFNWTRDTYEQIVAGLLPQHTVVKLLQKNKIGIPKKKQADTVGQHEV